MTPPATSRARSAALVLAAAILVGCTGSPTPARSPQAAPSPSPEASFDPPELPACEFPPKEKFPKWLPDDLPLPKKTYAMQNLDPIAGYKRVLLVVRMVLDDFVDYVLEKWPKKDWVLGVGDVEPGEVEDQFSKGKETGAFKAQAVFCDPGYTILYLIYSKERPDPAEPAPGIPPPRGEPLVPPEG